MALAGWLSYLERRLGTQEKVAGLIPAQGVYRRQSINACLFLHPPPL